MLSVFKAIRRISPTLVRIESRRSLAKTLELNNKRLYSRFLENSTNVMKPLCTFQ